MFNFENRSVFKIVNNNAQQTIEKNEQLLIISMTIFRMV